MWDVAVSLSGHALMCSWHWYIEESILEKRIVLGCDNSVCISYQSWRVSLIRYVIFHVNMAIALVLVLNDHF